MYKIIPIIDENGTFKFLVFADKSLVASFMTAKGVNAFLTILNAETVNDDEAREIDVSLKIFKKHLRKSQKRGY